MKAYLRFFYFHILNIAKFGWIYWWMIVTWARSLEQDHTIGRKTHTHTQTLSLSLTCSHNLNQVVLFTLVVWFVRSTYQLLPTFVFILTDWITYVGSVAQLGTYSVDNWKIS
jgi:hypothetical protein